MGEVMMNLIQSSMHVFSMLFALKSSMCRTRRFRPCTVFSTTLTIRARLIVSYHLDLDPGPLPRVARGTRRRRRPRLPRRARVQSTRTTVIPVPAAPVTMYLRLLLRQRRNPPVMTYLRLLLRQRRNPPVMTPHPSRLG